MEGGCVKGRNEFEVLLEPFTWPPSENAGYTVIEDDRQLDNDPVVYERSERWKEVPINECMTQGSEDGSGNAVMIGLPHGNPDPINHPPHYNVTNNGKSVEVIDAIEAWDLGYHLGNAVKYIARCQYKGRELEDLKKAVWYLQKKIDLLENCQ